MERRTRGRKRREGLRGPPRAWAATDGGGVRRQKGSPLRPREKVDSGSQPLDP